MARINDLGKRFPTVDTVTVEWKAYRRPGEGTLAEDGIFSHSIRAAAGAFDPLLPCSNPDCRDGGFEILEVVESMIGSRQQEKAGLLVCIGWEGTRARRTEPTPCTRVIDYRVRLTYRKKDDSRRPTGHQRNA
ncbi:MAG: hypothetical protein C3F12_02085 [Candidatus Methylomirabilota bacterium]|nr:hypothetical protein [Candidatus Methylomirabilis sp.]PWB48570.1 MAG: hypothetical protein C3F12_02085 [candidate division NC10 bacterium]